MLGELLHLLERIELIDEITFGDFDSDDHSDVKEIARRFIEPPVQQAKPDGQKAILLAMGYYSLHGSAPVQFFEGSLPRTYAP